jgi:molecular chaperone GrpE
MTEENNDEQFLEEFRRWLREARHEAARADKPDEIPPVQPTGDLNSDSKPSYQAKESPLVEPRATQVGLYRLVEEFTALRHELKLQTRSSRALEERLEAALALLGEAAATFRSAAAKQGADIASVGKPVASSLAELDEALDRGREQWEKNAERVVGALPSAKLAELEELFARQWWWQRRLTRAYHRQLCRQVEQMEEQSRSERQALVGALMSGFALIQQRLARNMANTGVTHIRTIGRTVDPDEMIVVEVVDAEGEAGQVVEEIRRGYTWQGTVLRPAEVRAIRPRFEKKPTDKERPTAVSE